MTTPAVTVKEILVIRSQNLCELSLKQEAQLPQRNSASAAHMEGG